jgi:hypothetical protein
VLVDSVLNQLFLLLTAGLFFLLRLQAAGHGAALAACDAQQGG